MSDERKMVDESDGEEVEQELQPEHPEQLGDPAIHENKGYAGDDEEDSTTGEADE